MIVPHILVGDLIRLAKTQLLSCLTCLERDKVGEKNRIGVERTDTALTFWRVKMTRCQPLPCDRYFARFEVDALPRETKHLTDS